MKLSEIKKNPENPRTIRGEQFERLKRSLQDFPQMMALRPIVVDAEGVVLGGNMRLEALKALKFKDIPDEWVKRADELTAEQKREFVVKDNAGFGEWNWEQLANEWSDLPLADWGLDIPDDWLAGGNVEEDESVAAELVDRAAELQEKWKVERGQIWQIGRHRLMCGDCRDARDVETLLDGAQINVAVTSPPYAEQREYDEDSGFEPIPPDRYVEWFKAVSDNVAAHIADDGSWFVNIKPPGKDLDTDLYVFDLVTTHVRQWGWHFATEFCWERIGVPKQVVLRFKNQFEPVYQFTRGRWKMRPENVRHASDSMIVPVGRGAGDTSWDKNQGGGAFFKPSQVRKRRNGTRGMMSGVQALNAAPGEALADGWAYPGNRLPPMMETHEATGHSAAFPVGLPAFFINAFSDAGDAIYEPFCGSGSTLIAAEQNGRHGFALEVSPKYCSIALERMSLLGLTPELEK